MQKVRVFAACAVIAVGAACSNSTTGTGDTTPTPAPAGNAIEVGMQEYAFVIEGSAQAGALTVNYDNTGDEIHMAIVGRLDEGKTLDDVRELIAEGDNSEPPPWFHDEPEDLSVLSPGKQASVTVDATEPGTYVLLCFIPSPEGQAHVALGMAETFDVTGSTDATPVVADSEISFSEDAVTVPTFASGSTVVTVSNEGDAPGDINIVKLEAGKTIEDLDAWFNSGEGAPPAEFYGGTHAIGPGTSKTMTYVLDAGEYTALATYEQEDGPPLEVTETFTVA